MAEKRWYYATVTETKTWNLTVEATSEDEANELAHNLHTGLEPDYTDNDVESEKVTKYVD